MLRIEIMRQTIGLFDGGKDTMLLKDIFKNLKNYDM